MPYLLDAVYLGLLVVCSPLLLLRSWRRGKYREGWNEKLRGRVPRRIGDAPCVWFHAVSVGEVLLLRPIVASLARRRPDWDIVISTTTTTGLSVARQTFPDHVTFYAPLDLSWAVREAIDRVRPSVLALVETELWPNLIGAASRTGAKVAVVNGRMSERSYRGYHRIRSLLGPTLRRLDAVAAQSDESAERFQALGVPAPRLFVTGSVKYDGLQGDRSHPKVRSMRRALGLSPSETVFVAGSTMEGEEAAALAAYRAARAAHPELRLVLVPRHPERGEALVRWLEAEGEPLWRRSTSGDASPPLSGPDGRPPILLIDTVGELSSIWGLADVAFVGGSLLPGRGGQNMMEPSAFGASVMFGPHTSNFRDAVSGLLSREAVRLVSSAEELAEALRADLDDPASARARGASARAFVMAQRGATERTVAIFDTLIGRRATACPSPTGRHHPEPAPSAA